jgi:cytochrome c-type biogenesis protein CcmE
MKKRYIVGGLIALAFISLALFSFNSASIEYASFEKAINTGKKVQVMGTWVKEMPSDYNAEKNLFSFFMKDESNKVLKVIYEGSTPNNFEISPNVVVTGKVNNNEFRASDILTKCPSKYEGQTGQHPGEVKVNN